MELWIENKRQATEVARSVEQFLMWTCVRAIVDADGVSDHIRLFASELPGLDLATAETLSWAQDLASALDGAFPPTLRLVTYAPSVTSPFEHPGPAWAKIIDSADRPGWVHSSPQEGFAAAIARGELFDAWMNLNSPGWDFDDAAQALQRLAGLAKDPMFSDLVEAWCESHEQIPGGF